MHLVGFIIRIYHDARSPERQYITMHGHLNVRFVLDGYLFTPYFQAELFYYHLDEEGTL